MFKYCFVISFAFSLNFYCVHNLIVCNFVFYFCISLASLSKGTKPERKPQRKSQRKRKPRKKDKKSDDDTSSTTRFESYKAIIKKAN